MTDHATEETGWNVVAANMVEAMPRRSLWDPVHEPMGLRDYIAATVIAIAGIAAAVLWSAVFP
jgi:hypothetical protein